MKKSIFAMAALGAMLFTACSSEEVVAPVGNDGSVTFTFVPEGTMSRAYSDGLTAQTLHYAAYETGSQTPVYTSTNTTDPQATVAGAREFKLTLNLVKGKSYDFVFWADKGTGSPYIFDAATQTITVDYTTPAGNDEGRDAFFQAIKELPVKGAVEQTVVMRRPFAQVNIGTSDLAAAAAAGTTVASTTFKVEGVHSTLNLLTGIASNPETVTFTASALPQGETFPTVKEGTTYDYVAMNYILTGSELEADDVQYAKSELMNAELVMTYENNDTQIVKVTNMPVRRNYRTNIFGALLTAPQDFTIKIDQNYNDPDTNIDYDEAVCVMNPEGIVECQKPALPKGVTPELLEEKNSNGVATDADGNLVFFATAAEMNQAMENATDIYLAANTEMVAKAHELKIPANGIKIHGNGATITGGECDLALDYTSFEDGSTVDIYVENLNNARVWGDAKVACTLNVTLNNCSFIGKGFGGERYSLGLIMMRGKSLATHNITIENSYCEGVQVGMHSANAGTFTFRNTTFKGVGIPVNIAKKSTDEAVVTIEDCRFIDCGLEENGSDAAWNYAAPVRVVDNIGAANSTSVTINNTTITGRKGQYDVLLMDYRDGKTWFPVDYKITNSGELVVKSSAE